MAKGRFSDDVGACQGSRTPLSICSSPAGVGIPSQCARLLPHLSSGYQVCLGRSYDGLPSGVGQLWRCPVEWCAVWKGSDSDCLGHFNEKHGGSALFALKNVVKFFPPWTVTRDVWQAALRPDVSGIAVDARLFHEAGCRLVHKYRVYKDPFPHPALRERVIPRLLSFVARAMTIAQLTQLHIAIPASGVPPGQVPHHQCIRQTLSSLSRVVRR